MRLVSFDAGQGERVGVLRGDMVTQLPEPDLITLLAGGEAALTAAGRAQGPTHARKDLRLLPPVTRPEKIIGIGLNFRSHAEEAKMEIPPVPVFFTKFNNTLIGHGAAVRIPPISYRIDYEGELAVVVGRTAYQVPAEGAMDCVAGYTVANDVTARDLQFKTSQWTAGKTLDTFCPLGPALVTRDEVPDPHSVPIKVRVGDEELQNGNTSDFIWGIPELIAFLSSLMTLRPGDVILTGTPGGIGASRTPRRWLKAGEVLTTEITGIGVLTNPIA